MVDNIKMIDTQNNTEFEISCNGPYEARIGTFAVYELSVPEAHAGILDAFGFGIQNEQYKNGRRTLTIQGWNFYDRNVNDTVTRDLKEKLVSFTSANPRYRLVGVEKITNLVFSPGALETVMGAATTQLGLTPEQEGVLAGIFNENGTRVMR